ncbi:MAG: hypothetical protein ACI841_002077 [Planctomycetota bacterium]|jgi:hypothetical protein
MSTTETKTKTVAPKRWRVWMRRGLIGALVLLLLGRIFLPVLLPPLLSKVAAGQGLELRYEKLDLSILTGSMELWHVDVSTAAEEASEGAEAVAGERLTHLEYLVADLDVSALLFGNLKIHRVELDGLDVFIERESIEEGWTFETLLPQGVKKPKVKEAEDDEVEDASEFEGFNFELPVELSAMRLQHLQLHVLDNAREPAFQTKLEVNIRLSDLGLEDTPARFELFAHSNEVLDACEVNGSFESAGASLDAKLDCAMRGLRLRELGPYLEPFGVRPRAERIGMQMALAVHAEGIDEEGRELSAQAKLTDISWSTDGVEQLAVDAIEFDAPRISPSHLVIETSTVRGVRARAQRLADGTLSVAGIDLVPTVTAAPTSPTELQSTELPAAESKESAEASGADAEVAESSSSTDTASDQQSFRAKVQSLRLEELQLSFVDDAVCPLTTLEWIIEEAAISDILFDADEPEHALQIQARMRSPEILEHFEVSGSLTPFAPKKTCELDVNATGILPQRLSPYLTAAGLRSDFKSGSFEAKLTAELVLGSKGELRAEAGLSGIRLMDQGELFGIESLAIKGVHIDPLTNTTRIEDIALRGTTVALRRDAQGSFHFFGLATGVAPGAPDPRLAANRKVDIPRAHSRLKDGTRSQTSRASEAEDTDDAVADGSDADQSAPAVVDEADQSAPTARVQVDHIGWTETAIQFVDESHTPARELKLADLGFDLRSLVLGGDPADPAPAPALMKLWFASQGLAQELALQGSLLSKPGPLDLTVDMTLSGRGLSLDAVEPWLTELGIESQLVDGRFDAKFDTTLVQRGDDLHASFELNNLAYGTEDELWLGLERVSLPNIVAGPNGVRVGELLIDAPFLALARDAEGGLQALGIRIPPPVPSDGTAAPAVEESDELPALETGVATAAAAAAADSTEPAPAAAPDAPSLTLDSLQLNGARIAWKDAALAEPIQTALTLDVALQDLALGAGQAPASLELRLGLEEVMQELQLSSTLQLDPSNLEISSDITMAGLRAGPLAAYFPAGIEMPLTDGTLRVRFEAKYVELPDGTGNAAHIALSDLDYRQADDDRALLAMKHFLLSVPRIDTVNAIYDIEELRIAGLQLDSRRTLDGSLDLLGIAISPAPESAVEAKDLAQPIETAQETSPTAKGEEPTAAEANQLAAEANDKGVNTPADTSAIEVIASAAPGEAAPVDSQAIAAALADVIIPTVNVGLIDLGIDSLRFLDESDPAAQQLDASFHLRSAGPSTWISPDAEELPPIVLSVSAAAPPILRELTTAIRLTPFQSEPGLEIDFAMHGIRGEGITEVLPELAAVLDGSELPNGEFGAKLRANLLVRRRSPVDFDLSGGFGVEFAIDHIALQDKPEGKVLLGLESLQASIKSIRLESGDVHVERIELVNPVMHASKSPEGLHVAGLIVKLAPTAEATEDATSDAEPVAGEEVADVSYSPADESNAEPSEPGPEFRLDELLVSGADVSFVDTSVTPAMHMPISDIDVELKRFTTRTLVEEQPFRFRATMYGAGIQLPERDVAGSLVGGLLGSIGSLITSEGDYETEERPVFDEIVLRGSMSLGPEPKGWTQLKVRALELPAFRGPALDAGVDIGDGLLNETAMLHFDGMGGMRANSNTTLSYLSLSEPADGPISSYLKLPAPIDTVLFVLKDEEGDQNLPLSLTIEDGAASVGTILGAVGRTLGIVIGEAIASSPMRIIGGVLDLAGLDSDPVELSGDEIVELNFAAGDVQEPADMAAALAPLVEVLRHNEAFYLVVEHELSAADLARSDILANPPAHNCLDLAENLRRQRTELLAKREREAEDVAGSFAIGRWDEAKTQRAKVRQTDLEIGRTEAALDRVFDRTAPGAERRNARRARGTALEVARRRLSAVAGHLKSQAVLSIGTRVDTRRPRFGVTPDIDTGRITVSVHQRR